MYSVYLLDYNTNPTADTPTPSREPLYIYDAVIHDEGLMVIEPNLSLEANKSGSFSCSLPQTNYGFGRIIKGVTRVVVTKDEKVIFMGRINSEDRDLYLNQKIIGDGALSYLNDSLSEKKTLVNLSLFDLLTYIFNNHNSKFPNEPWKQFYLEQSNCLAKFVGQDVTDATSDKLTSYNINFDKSLELVLELVNLANGVIKIEYNSEHGYWDVYIYDKFNLPVTSNQPIEFGKNLLDLVQSYSLDDFCTAVAPFGGDALQVSKEIGDVVAGGTNAIYNHLFLRPTADVDGDYVIYGTDGNPYYESKGYWAFEFDIDAYNNTHDNKLKRLYLSWRGYKFEAVDGSGELSGYICDCAWRIYQRIWQDGSWHYQTLGYRELKTGEEGFESEINEMIDLTDPQYKNANVILMGGWGGLVTPLIRRDAIIIEENDRLTIEKCAAFERDENGLTHKANSPYLLSEKLIDLYGLIEKKLEYDIEDKSLPMKNWVNPYNGELGMTTVFPNSVLGYIIDVDGSIDLDRNKGDYQIVNFAEEYTCIQYEIPGLDDPKRPRGVFLTTRMHHYGEYELYDEHGTYVHTYLVNGMYAVYDTSWQVLAFKQADEAVLGSGFTSIEREYIDLSDPKYYGAKYIRVGGYTGGNYPLELIPSDDNYSRNLLMDQAKLYLTQYQWEKIVIEANAVDLNMENEQWDMFDICMNAVVVSSFHGIENTMPITALDIQLDMPENNSIKLGYDNDEYLSAQLAENTRLMSISQSIEERRNSNGYT